MEYMNNTSVTEISRGSFDGKSVYIVHFADCQSVYVDLFGKILAIQMAPTYSSNNSNEEQNQQFTYSDEDHDDDDNEPHEEDEEEEEHESD